MYITDSFNVTPSELPSACNHSFRSALGNLRNNILFSNLDDVDIQHFKPSTQMRLHKKGKMIYLQGEAADFFYIIDTGWIKLFRTMPEGEEVIIDMVTTGHMFGESALFEQDHHMCSAQVVEDAYVLGIPSAVLREQISLHPQLALNMLSSMSKHHRHHYGALAFNAMLSAPQRIGCFLLRFCASASQKDVTFDLPYDKTLIADTLGMKGATFSRSLNILRQKIGIDIHDRRVGIHSVQKLSEFVYGSNSGKYSAENL